MAKENEEISQKKFNVKSLLKSVYGFLKSVSLKNMLLKTLIFAFIVFLSFFSPFFILVVFLAVCLFVSIENNEKSLAYLLFFFSFRSWFFVTPFWILINCLQFIYAFIVLFHSFRYAYLVIKKQRKLDLLPFILLSVLILYTFMPYGNISILMSLHLGMMLLVALLFVLNKKLLDLREMTIMYVIGIIISCVLGFALLVIPFVDFPFTKYYAGDVLRFSGLFGNPNSLYITAFIGLIPLTCLFINNKAGWEFCPLFLCVSMIGFLAVSRFYSLIYPIIFIAFMFFYWYKHKSIKALKPFAVLLVGMFCCFIIFFPYFEVIFTRLETLSNEGAGIGNELSEDPGRWGLWRYAFIDWLKNAKTIILGWGAGADTWYIGEHNFYLWILRRLGIVGALLMAAYILTLFYIANDRKWKLKFNILWVIIIIAGLNLVIESLVPYIFSIMITFIFLSIQNENQDSIKLNVNNKENEHLIGVGDGN